MNKKVLTLCAGLLLAGGLLSNAEASTQQLTALAGSEPVSYVIGQGKYFKLHRTEHKAASLGTGGSWTSNAEYYLAIVNGAVVFTSDADLYEQAAGYWTLKDVTIPGESMVGNAEKVVQLVNAANGYVLELNSATGLIADDNTPAENRVNRFYVDKNGNNNAILAYEVISGGVTTKYILGDTGTETTAGSDCYAVQGLKNTGASAGTFNTIQVEAISEIALPAKDLNAQLNGGFELNFSSNGKAYKNLTRAEAFAGKLTAIGVNLASTAKDKDIAESTDTKYYFRTSDGRYVILDDEYLGEKTSSLKGDESAFYRGYNFTTISEHAFKQLDADELKNATFTVFRTYDFNDTDSLIISLPEANTLGQLPTGGLNPGEPNNESGLRMFVTSVLGNDVLTTVDYTRANDKLADIEDNDYDAPGQVGAWAPYIKFGASNIIDWSKFAGKVWNITDKEGNVLSPKFDAADIDDYAQLFAPAEEVDLTNPEGQWLLDDAGNCFVNRESGEQAIEASRNWVIRDLGNDKYALYNTQYDIDDEYTIYIKEAKNAELGWTENGYVKFDMDEEQNNGKYLSFETTFGTAYVGKDADDNVILTTDASEAIEFRVKQMSHDFRDHDGVIAPDTLQHYTSFINVDKDGKLFVDVDTLQFFHYALYENFTEKYLTYNKKTKKFQLSDESWTSNAHENFDQEGATVAFVVKTREDGSYIWVRDYAIDYDECKDDATHDHEIQLNWNKEDATFDNIFEVNFGSNALTVWDEDGDEFSRKPESNGQAHKLYAGTQKGGFLTDMADIYNYNDNDRITIEATNKVEYRRFDTLDTIKVSLEAKPNFFLYEHNENGTNFLSMEHVADADMKAAIFVDTAYVRNETYRPQYLLAVGANHVDEIWDNHGSKDPVHLLHADTTYGRFLVNMVDSAKAWKGSVKTNPYIHEELNGNYYYRLAFIDGYHTGDALYLNTENAKTKINLGNNNEKVCTFSFRYVDEDREGVKIETTYDGKTRGWLKYQNNVPVVTNDYEDAHVFLIDNTTTEAPTANEAINAEDAVSVTAIDGAVVIKGAEGKNVVIATILGKVVANETVNSDNETIAVPAGIAVVSVDGESFKVVVK